MSLRFFWLGFPKEGTTTLTHVLRSAGMSVAHSRHPGGVGCPPGYLLCRAYAEGKDPTAYLSWVEAFTHPCVVQPPRKGGCYWAQLDEGLVSDLRRRYPDAVFALGARPVEHLVATFRRWKGFASRLAEYEIPYLPAGVGRTDAELAAWVEGHRARTRALLRGDARFVEINVEDGDASAATLRRSLGVLVDGWPHANRTERKG